MGDDWSDKLEHNLPLPAGGTDGEESSVLLLFFWREGEDMGPPFGLLLLIKLDKLAADELVFVFKVSAEPLNV